MRRNIFSIFAKNVKVLVSEDGETWKEAGKRENFEDVDDLKVVYFSESVYGQYVRLVLEDLNETNKSDGVFTTVSMVNLYEDTTKLENYKPVDENPSKPGDGSNGNNSNEPTDDKDGTVWIVVGVAGATGVAAEAAVGAVIFIKHKK